MGRECVDGHHIVMVKEEINHYEWTFFKTMNLFCFFKYLVYK